MKICEILSYLKSEDIAFSFSGDDGAEVEGFSSLSHYRANTFTWVKNAKCIPAGLDEEKLQLVFTEPDVSVQSQNVIHTPQSKKAFFGAMAHFSGQEPLGPSQGKNCYIAPTVKIGKNVCIGHNCTLDGDITIGDNTVIWHHVTILNRVSIGKGSEIRSGVVIGHDDSISFTEDENHQKTMIRHFGGVRIGDDVLIGENSTVCRGTIDDTTVEDGVKIDALTQISHNCHLQKNAVLIAGSRLCGSVTVEEDAQVVGAIIRNQCCVGRGAMVGMGAVVVKDVPPGAVVVGNPARPLDGQ